ncbi:hypothetical protein TTHERM_000000031 (macronuclear) [Tetrahymena thermophila SB210]|uniref:Uncharacterized protein n=1 Tax=Tetrahymena thermophila (strain SB210) TaxID=312017 RepID=W7XK73_TETTS|nr:hypothetical protein TTHERM_000000031 [Tetrahymena thermophila SB210]EWS76281.1 hypothetical protein TTHERM_000000031 [Tetrahymena thermophila SB210]|eukprot:XP_012651065.1 hypothetical protein TTHERM_000000031 [Tetrahymena thermophila SB210]
MLCIYSLKALLSDLYYYQHQQQNLYSVISVRIISKKFLTSLLKFKYLEDTIQIVIHIFFYFFLNKQKLNLNIFMYNDWNLRIFQQILITFQSLLKTQKRVDKKIHIQEQIQNIEIRGQV